MSWWKSLAKLSDFENKSISKVLICWTVKSLHHFTNNNLNIFIGCHSVKQFQSFLFKSLVFWLKTLNNN